MSTLNLILLILTIFSSFLCAGSFYFVFRALVIDKKKIAYPFSFTPPVSILKPLQGLDSELEKNLQAFCHLDYPNYEMIFCFKNAKDPAYSLADRLGQDCKNIPIKIVVDPAFYGYNPKINNLVAGINKAKNDLILISDGDIRPHRDYLKELANHFQDPQVGLVTNLIAGSGNRSLGAILENLYLNSFVIGSVTSVNYAFKWPCVIGKSMIFKKSDIEKIGGILSFKDFLAEDYLIGRRLQKIGKKVLISPHIVSCINTHRSLKKFLNRHFRWTLLRYRLSTPAYLCELLVNPIFFSLILFFTSRFSKGSLILLIGITIYKIFLEAFQNRVILGRFRILTHLFVPIKDLIFAFLWFVPFVKRSVTWRDHKLIMKRYTELEPKSKSG
jgi:ceramide glucosyltransferase